MSAKVKLLSQFNPSINHQLYLIRNRLLQSLKKLIPRLKGKVMDFGCGIKPYKPLFICDEYVGVDYVGEGETYSKEHVDVIYNGKELPFPKESFDGIFSTEVFEHIFNLPAILKELHRVLKKDGVLLVTCPFTMPEHEIPNDYARYTSFAIKDLLESHGFEMVHYEKSGNFIEAIFQLRIIYWDQNLLYPFRNIPVLRSILRNTVFTMFNLGAIVCSKVFPENKRLYLNNVILAKKI